MSRRPLKVYGWESVLPSAPVPHHLVRAIVAAHSKAEAARLAGYDRASQMFNLCDTGNATEIEVATARPGVVFWTGIGVWPLDYQPISEGEKLR